MFIPLIIAMLPGIIIGSPVRGSICIGIAGKLTEPGILTINILIFRTSE
jgi:hypothetical protein